jgi:hypothetical protein
LVLRQLAEPATREKNTWVLRPEEKEGRGACPGVGWDFPEGSSLGLAVVLLSKEVKGKGRCVRGPVREVEVRGFPRTYSRA